MMQLALLALSGCLAIGPESDHVVARDLAARLPAFAALPPDTPLALAPAPGVQRLFRAADLRGLAARWKVDLDDREVCVERPVKPLDPARVLDAIRRQLPRARIEIRDYSRTPVPEGDLDFPLSGLRETPVGGIWMGSVRYAGTRRFVIWAKVDASVKEPVVVAAESLRPGRAIEATQLRVEEREGFPSAIPLAASIDQIAGKTARRAIAAGTAICLSCIEATQDVARGDTVRVEVHVGGAYLELEGRAESGGSEGQTIPVLNPGTRRRFAARVAGKGRVSVEEGRR